MIRDSNSFIESQSLFKKQGRESNRDTGVFGKLIQSGKLAEHNPILDHI